MGSYHRLSHLMNEEQLEKRKLLTPEQTQEQSKKSSGSAAKERRSRRRVSFLVQEDHNLLHVLPDHFTDDSVAFVPDEIGGVESRHDLDPAVVIKISP